MNEFIYRKIEAHELSLHQGFRFALFQKAGYLSDEKCPEGLDIDGYDEYSDHFLAFHGESIVACSRLTYLGKCAETYSDLFWHLPDLGKRRNEIAEVNRFAVTDGYRNLRQTLELRLGLTRVMCQAAARLGITLLITGMHSDFFRLMNRQGKIPVEQVAAVPKDYAGNYYEGYVENNSNPMVFLKMPVASFHQ